MDLKPYVDIANIVVALGVIVAITQININRKQLHLSTIKRCIDEFRKLTSDKESLNEKDVRQYIDLVNEELFYFQHNYLPEDIAFEWLDGMLDYMPLTDSNSIVFNSNNCIPLLNNQRELFLAGYPRIKCTFTIKQSYNIELVYNSNNEKSSLRIATRKAIVEELYENVKRFAF